MAHRAPSATYNALLARLYNTNKQFVQVKQGLDNIIALDRALGSPARKVPRVVHVAGTNGKGSVAWKAEAGLRSLGWRTGLFVSPHLTSFRERIQVGGELIPEAAIEESLPRVLQAAEQHGIPATFFEIVTALGFLHFAERDCEAVVLEVGLGGRLDATNIVPRPAVTVLTTVGLDHTRILGDTVEKIAREKLGIARRGVPMVCGFSDDLPMPFVEQHLAQLGVPLFRPVPPEDLGDLDYNARNTILARAVLDVLLGRDCGVDFSLLERALPPGRFERRTAPNGVPVILDVGHNPQALTALFRRLGRTPGVRLGPLSNLRVVFSMSADKDVDEAVHHLLEHVPAHRIYFSRSNSARAADPEVFRAAVQSSRKRRPLPASDAIEPPYTSQTRAIDALRKALTDAQAGADANMGTGIATPGSESRLRDVVLICGSFYMMPEVRKELGIDEPMDDPNVEMHPSAELLSGLARAPEPVRSSAL